MTTVHLNQRDLSQRWGISPRTIERWRCINEGPVFLRIRGRVLYRLKDVEKFEEQNLHPGQPNCTHDPALNDHPSE